MAETLRRSSLGALAVGSPVNLERAVRVQDRLGGHVVQGHVDGTGASLVRDARRALDRRARLAARRPGRYVVEKGSITVDGVSLTVSAIGADWFEVSLIPTTLGLTTLGARAPGDPVNLEVDVIAKHVEKLLQSAGRIGARPPRSPMSAEPPSRAAQDSSGLDTIERAVADIAAGKAVVVVDDEDRENEGDLIFAAELATPELMAFTIRWSSGYVCVPDDRARTSTGSSCR